jgi:hypothetical protein
MKLSEVESLHSMAEQIIKEERVINMKHEGTIKVLQTDVKRSDFKLKDLVTVKARMVWAEKKIKELRKGKDSDMIHIGT